MGQKIHPLGLRLGITQTHRSRWIARADVTRSRWLLQDKAIREYLYKEFKDAKIEEIVIHRHQSLLAKQVPGCIEFVKVFIHASESSVICPVGSEEEVLPGLGEKLAVLCAKKRLPHRLIHPPVYRVYPKLVDVVNGDQQAYAIANRLIEQLEDRTLFRKALKTTIRELQKPKSKGSSSNTNRQPPELKVLEGVRIQLSGRLNGAEIARIEWFKQGRVPLQTLRANIDYVSKTAKTTHGILGIKVWTFKGEIRNRKVK